MQAQRFVQITGLVFAALGVLLAVEGWKLGLTGMYGPGPGMFAGLIGIGLAAAGLAWCALATLGRVEVPEPDAPPEPGGRTRVVLVLASLIVFALLLIPLGFNLSMLLLLLVLLIGFKREYVGLKIVIAFAASFGTHYVFESILRVPLPYSSIPFLRSLGL